MSGRSGCLENCMCVVCQREMRENKKAEMKRRGSMTEKGEFIGNEDFMRSMRQLRGNTTFRKIWRALA